MQTRASGVAANSWGNFSVTGVNLRFSFSNNLPCSDTQIWHRDYNSYDVYKSFHSLFSFDNFKCIDSITQPMIRIVPSSSRENKFLKIIFDSSHWSSVNRFNDLPDANLKINPILTTDCFTLSNTSAFHSESPPKVSHCWVIYTYGTVPDFRNKLLPITESYFSLLEKKYDPAQLRFLLPTS